VTTSPITMSGQPVPTAPQPNPGADKSCLDSARQYLLGVSDAFC